MKKLAKGGSIDHCKQRRTLRDIHAWGMERPKKERPTSVNDWYNMRELNKLYRTEPRRFTIGYIRAFIGPHYFAGCYPGAEFD